MSVSRKVIGIGGVSRSGKSSFATLIQIMLLSAGKSTRVFDMDDYMVAIEKIPKIRDRTDWEHSNSVDWDKLIGEIHLTPEVVVIVEGIFVFANDDLLHMLDIKIKMNITRETFLERRKAETRWGEEPEWYLEHVWRSNNELNQLAKADITINPDRPLESAAKSIVRQLMSIEDI